MMKSDLLKQAEMTDNFSDNQINETNLKETDMFAFNFM